VLHIVTAETLLTTLMQEISCGRFFPNRLNGPGWKERNYDTSCSNIQDFAEEYIMFLGCCCLVFLSLAETIRSSRVLSFDFAMNG
jgi:hypothetical protein